MCSTALVLLSNLLSIFLFFHCCIPVDIFIYKKKIISSWNHDSRLLYFQGIIYSDVLFSFATTTPGETQQAQRPRFLDFTLIPYFWLQLSQWDVSFHGSAALLEMCSISQALITLSPLQQSAWAAQLRQRAITPNHGPETHSGNAALLFLALKCII